MNDNPYQAPEPSERSESRPRPAHSAEQSFDSLWDTFFWTFAGFAAGTFLMARFMLASALRYQVIGGMLYGGIPLAILGFYLTERRRRRRTRTPVDESSRDIATRTRD